MGWVGNSPAQSQEFQVNLNEAIRNLYEEKKRIDRLIAAIERRNAATLGVPRKRRKMSAARRLEVSRRMREYWAARRARSEEGSVLAVPPASGELRP
jgi:hypothetical protein